MSRAGARASASDTANDQVNPFFFASFDIKSTSTHSKYVVIQLGYVNFLDFLKGVPVTFERFLYRHQILIKL